jgi:hypothetical protein
MGWQNSSENRRTFIIIKIMNILLAFQLFKNMGIRYTTYRISHEIDKRSGLLKRRHPTNPKLKEFISLKKWKKW